MEQFVSVCIAGCHGKSTTTGMLRTILQKEKPFGYLIGDGQGHLDAQADTFVLEACEYQRHFLSYHPDYAIVTNIELDHIDYYKSMEDYVLAFQQFVDQVKKACVVNGDDPWLKTLNYPCDKITFGFETGNDYQIRNLVESEQGIHYELYFQDQKVSIQVPYNGKAYAYDSAAAFVLALQLGVSAETAANALKEYQGIHRRFEAVEEAGSVLIDDYAHHPTAIRLMIEAVRSRYPDLPVVALYKPDRYSRLQFFLDDFASALNTADRSVIFDFPENAKPEDDSVTVTIDDLLERLDQGMLLKIDEPSARVLTDLGPAIFLFMSSKDIYLLRDMVQKLLKEALD